MFHQNSTANSTIKLHYEVLGGCGPYIYVARACADARHANDTRSFPQTPLFALSKSRLIASWARHLLVTEKKRTPHLGPPPFKGARKRTQRLAFWVRGPAGGVGVFHAKGWWPKSSRPPLEKFVFLAFRREGSGMSRNFAGMSWTLGELKKFEQKKFVRIFHSLFF